MSAATSLIQLILKKWGDNTSGAAKELEQKVGFPESVANRIATGELPMDEASRLKRAQELGYDTSRPVYHGTDTDFKEFDPDRSIGNQFWSTTNRDAVENGEVGAAGHGVIKEMYHGIQNPAGWDEYDKLLLDEISGRGHDGLKLSDPDGHATMVAFDPKQYKSTDAAFDPQYTGPNIMGGLLAGGVGLGALGQSEDADASVASLARRGLSVISEPSHLKGGLFSVRSKDGNEVAYAEMGDNLDGGLSARYMEVYPEHRGDGLMGETYDAIEEISGKKITPSYWLTEDGAKFWAKRDRGLIEELYNNGDFNWDPDFEDVVGRILHSPLLGPVTVK